MCLCVHSCVSVRVRYGMSLGFLVTAHHDGHIQVIPVSLLKDEDQVHCSVCVCVCACVCVCVIVCVLVCVCALTCFHVRPCNAVLCVTAS